MRTRYSLLLFGIGMQESDKQRGNGVQNRSFSTKPLKYRYGSEIEYSQSDSDSVVTAVAQVVVDVKEWEEHFEVLHWPSSAAGAVVLTY